MKIVLYGQLLQGGVSTSSLEYSIHHIGMCTANVQHLERLVPFNGSFHFVQECFISHFLHKQKTVEATNKSFQLHDTNTASCCVCISTCMPTRPTLMTAPADTYVKNAVSTFSVLSGQYTESVLEWVHEVLVSHVSPYPPRYCCCALCECATAVTRRGQGLTHETNEVYTVSSVTLHTCTINSNNTAVVHSYTHIELQTYFC